MLNSTLEQIMGTLGGPDDPICQTVSKSLEGLDSPALTPSPCSAAILGRMSCPSSKQMRCGTLFKKIALSEGRQHGKCVRFG